jgi:hypothetical protein
MLRSVGRLGLVGAFGVLGCACSTMSVPEFKVNSTVSYASQSEQNGLLVAVYPMTDAREIDDAFKVDLLAKSVIPVLLVAENMSSSVTFVLKQDGVSVSGLEGLGSEGGLRRSVTSEKTGQSVATAGLATMAAAAVVAPVLIVAAPLVLVGLKMSSDAMVIEHNMADRLFYSQTIDPGQRAAGYFYIKLSEGASKTVSYEISVDALDPATGQMTRFRFPITSTLR